MADVSQIKLPNGTTYNVKDATARSTFAQYRRLDDPNYDEIYVTELNSGNIINTGAARFLNPINGNITGHAALDLALTGGTVTGTLVLSKSQDASGTANNGPALIVGGIATQTHLEFDNNEIMAKADGVTTAPLYINNDGGNVYLSGQTVYASGTTMYATTFSGKATSAGTSDTTSQLKGFAEANVTTAASTGCIRYQYNVNRDTTGLFAYNDNSNSILTLNRHSGNYNSQLGFSSNGRLYYRAFDGGALDTTTAWKDVMFTTDTYSGTLTKSQITTALGYTPPTSDTNYYHTTGSWSGLTYTATANGGAGALAFTIPTGTSATTVAVGNHNHDGTYVKTSGDTMTGNLTFSKPTEAGQKRGFVFAGVTDSAGLYYLEPNLSDDGRMRFVISDNDTDPIEMAWSLYRSSGSEIPGEHVVHSFNARGYTLTPIQEKSGTYNPISIVCSVNNHGSIGSSSLKWKEVYATTFYGALSGNATSATTATSATSATTSNQLAENTSYQGSAFVVHTDNSIFKTYLSRYNHLGIDTSSQNGMLVLAGTWSSSTYTSELALGMGDHYGIYYRGKNNGTEQAWQAVGRFTATPTSGQVMITDGTTGGMKSSGYTIATSVPANAVFTDTKYALDVNGNNVRLKKDGTVQDTITVPYATSAGSATDSTKLPLAGGNMTGASGIQFPTTSGNNKTGNWISAGGGYSTGSGKSGVKIISCEQSDCISGLGQDLSGLGGYDFSLVAGANTNGNCFISFLKHTIAAATTYTRLGHFDGSGNFTAVGNSIGVVFGVSASNGTSGGISLYSGAGNVDNYGIAFRKTADKGKHGYVQSDWATYFTMNSGATTRGWVFKLNQTNGNVASISGAGNAVFNGSLTLGGNATNTSGVRQIYNATTQSLDFVFVA